MIKIPVEDIIKKIKEEADLSDEEINTRIEEKLESLSGLISKEGAAHIVANELGIKLIEDVSGKLKIKNVLTGMRSVETVGKVIRVFEVREFQSEKRSGKVGSMIIADETDQIRIVLWNDQADLLKDIKEEDIVKISGGYVRENQGRKEVHLNDNSKVIRNPEGETVGEVKTEVSTDAVRKKINDLKETDSNVELLGTIVTVYPPRFYEICPECGKRARQSEDQFVCPEHNSVTPAYSYVVNAVLDDGTETLRIVCFRNQAERLFGLAEEQMLSFKDSPDNFEEVKNKLMGSIVKIVGRVTKNTMFDRLELISQLVFTDPNPEEEINRLNKEIDEVKS